MVDSTSGGNPDDMMSDDIMSEEIGASWIPGSPFHIGGSEEIGPPYIAGSPLEIAGVRWAMPQPCISVDVVDANWSNLDPPIVNLQAQVVESCGKRHPGGRLFGIMRAWRKSGMAQFEFTIDFGPLNPFERKVVARTMELIVDDPPPYRFEMVVNGVCVTATTISGPWTACLVA